MCSCMFDSLFSLVFSWNCLPLYIPSASHLQQPSCTHLFWLHPRGRPGGALDPLLFSWSRIHCSLRFLLRACFACLAPVKKASNQSNVPEMSMEQDSVHIYREIFRTFNRTDCYPRSSQPVFLTALISVWLDRNWFIYLMEDSKPKNDYSWSPKLHWNWLISNHV